MKKKTPPRTPPVRTRAQRNIHDLFFRKVMSNKQIVADFLHNYLPEPVRQHINLASLVTRKDTFVGAKQKAYYSDLLYSVSITGAIAGDAASTKGYVYVLFEHKSYHDHFIALQLLRYMVEIWELHREQHPKEKSLPLIIPVVVYHGKRKGNAPCLAELVSIPDTNMSAYVPNFAINFCDFSPTSDEVIRGDSLVLQASLYCLKAVYHDDAKLMLVEVFKCIALLGDAREVSRWLWILGVYIARALNVENTVVQGIAKQYLTEKKAGVIMTLADRWEARGREQGMEQGIVLGEAKGRTEGLTVGRMEGRTEGRHTLLTRQLTRKFGPQALTPALQQRLLSATVDQLDHWGERLLDAQNVDEVFREN